MDGSFYDFALDAVDRRIYWLLQEPALGYGKYTRSDFGGGNEVRVASMATDRMSYGCTVDVFAQRFFWTQIDTGSGEGSICTVSPLDGSGQPTEIVGGIPAGTYPWSVEIDRAPEEPQLYWTEMTGGPSGKIRRANYDGSGVRDIVTHTAFIKYFDFLRETAR
jgi:hypothetical protein